MQDLYQSYFKTKKPFTGVGDLDKEQKIPAHLFSTLPKMPILKASPGLRYSSGIMSNFKYQTIHLLKVLSKLLKVQNHTNVHKKQQRASGCVHFP